MEQHQHPFLKLLPGADNIGARLALLVMGCVLTGLALLLLALMEILEYSPVEMEKGSFFWLTVWMCTILLGFLVVLWVVVHQEILKPLNKIRELSTTEDKGSFGRVAATMQEMHNVIEQTQAALDESHANLRQVEKLALVGKLAAGVAHSVRNPLTSVKLRLFSLAKGLDLSSRQEEDFTVISDAVRHIDNVLGNFLEFSRRPKLDFAVFSAHQLLDSALKLLENRLSAFPVTLKVTRLDRAHLQINGDLDQLLEALLNLLLNACEAMEYSGSLTIKEQVEIVRRKRYFIISIADSGPGISEKDLEVLFVPFFSTKDAGTGLGLPIAKGIVEEHGGTLFVATSSSKGTEFVISIPLNNITSSN